MVDNYDKIMAAADDPISQAAVTAARKNPKRGKAGSLWQQNLIDNEIMRIGKEKSLLFSQIEGLLHNKTDAEQRFISTPISEYTANDHKLWTINPDLMALSKKYDSLVAQMGQSNNEMTNLSNAKEEMMKAVNDQKTAVNKSADSARSWTALSKAIQIGDAQWTAGMQWATAGQLNKAQWEIANKFAPTFADIETQRQTGLGTAAQLQSGIPTALSSINAENATANYNNALARKTNTPATSTASSTFSNKSTPSTIFTPPTGPGEYKINPTTQKYEWVPSPATKVNTNPWRHFGF